MEKGEVLEDRFVVCFFILGYFVSWRAISYEKNKRLTARKMSLPTTFDIINVLRRNGEYRKSLTYNHF